MPVSRGDDAFEHRQAARHLRGFNLGANLDRTDPNPAASHRRVRHVQPRS
jgi:hypothetical protein